MKRIAKTLAGIAATSLLSVPANSEALFCGTKVAYVGVSPNGNLNPNFEGMGTPVLCNLNGTFTPNAAIAPISAEVCKAWYASLTTALATQKTVILAFDFGATPLPSCGALPVFSWAIPNPFPYWMEFNR